MTPQADILIAGAGPNGQLLAHALAQKGFSVALAGTAPPPGPRSYALTLGSQRLLAHLGLWDFMKDRVQPMLEIRVSDGRMGQGVAPQVLEFSHLAINQPALGYMTPEPAILEASEAKLAEQGGITRVQMPESLPEAALTVVTDGKNSPLARSLGFRKLERDYEQAAVSCTLSVSRPQAGVAHQVFYPTGPLAILPLRDGHVSIVWTNPTAQAEALHALGDDAFLAALRPAFGDFMGEIALAGPRGMFPLKMSVAESYVKPGVVLLGDAAHAIHPLAGQGLNAGMRDIAALVDVLVEARGRGEDLGQEAVLNRYQVWRRADNLRLATAMSQINALFSNDNGALRMMRDMGMGLVNALPSAKRALMMEAAGLTGELPSLMR